MKWLKEFIADYKVVFTTPERRNRFIFHFLMGFVTSYALTALTRTFH